MASPGSQLPAHGHQADIQASFKQGRLAGMVIGAGATVAILIIWTYMWWLVVAGAVGGAAWVGFRVWSKSKKAGAQRVDK
jgi:hypothetical protein